MDKLLFHSSYKYEPLEHAQSIRLVTIYQGARHPDQKYDPVHCELRHARLDQDPHYEALSYVWGDPADQECIQLGTAQFPVTRNLYRAILRLRTEQANRTFWIDAICINQQDVVERNKQVSLMSLIYRTALGVTVWLGEQSHLDRKSLALVLKILEKLSSGLLLDLRNQLSKDGLGDTANSIVYDTLKNELQTFSSPFSKDAHVWKTLRAFLDQIWFHRAWILQEVVFSMKSTRVQCNTVCINFETLHQACLSIEALRLGSSLASSGNEDGLIRHMGRLQHYIRNNPRHHHLKLSSLLSTRRPCLATDPRDKVFALVGLANNAQELSPDYFKSVAEVYSQTAEHILFTDKDLSLLSEVKGLRSGSELPSWAPDWRIDPKVTLLASTNSNGTKRYHASGTSYPRLTIAKQGKLLSIYGILFDKISQYLGRTSSISEGKNFVPRMGLITYGNGLWPEMARSVYPDGVYHPTGEPLIQVYNRVLLSDQSLISERLDRDAKATYYPETLAFIDAKRSNNDHPLFHQAFKRIKNLGIDLEAAIKTYIKGPELYAMQDIMKYLHKSPMMDNVPDDVSSYIYSERVAAEITISEGRRLFISVSGHMGLCPEATEPEDVICILFGADVPFVLRPLQNGNFLLVGECYIDGFMDGEALLKPISDSGLGDVTKGLRTPARELILQ